MKFYFNSPRFFYFKTIKFIIKEIFYSIFSLNFKQSFRFILLFIFKFKSLILINDKTLINIILNKKDAIYCTFIYNHHIVFYKNGMLHNAKNASYIHNSGYKAFYLNDEYYGNHNNFTKQSWRRFVKMQVFL